MSYSAARQAFVENKDLIGTQAMDDPQLWNLNNGLLNLTLALQADLARIQQTLDQILRTLRP